MWKECQMKEKSQESINGREVYWTETHGGQLLSGPKLIRSCSVYQEEEEEEEEEEGRIMSEIKSRDTIGNRTHDQPTGLLRAPSSSSSSSTKKFQMMLLMIRAMDILQ